MISVQGLNKVFRSHGRTVHAVKDVSFEVRAGEVVGLLGPNGAGKTTIIKSILGLMRPTTGRVLVGGHDSTEHPLRALTMVSAVLEGSRNIYWRLTVWENLRFFAGLNGIDEKQAAPYFEYLLDKFGLADRRNAIVLELSAGMKQKTAVICAIAKRTSIIFLDEPTLGLDVETSYELRETLRDLAREEQRTIILSSHDMDVVQDICERVIIISGGRIIADDRVDNLLSLFRTRDYHLVLAGADGALERALPAVFPQARLSHSEFQTTIDLVLPSADKVYTLIDLVRQSGASIETITQKEPDLEQAFLGLVRRERENNEALGGL